MLRPKAALMLGRWSSASWEVMEPSEWPDKPMREALTRPAK